MEEPTWLSRGLIVRVHDRQLLEHGGSSGIRDEGLLDSALARPRHLLTYGGEDVDMAALAAAYACGISRNHAFVDGNKRTAAVACELFLELNGCLLLAEDAELYPLFMGVAAGEIDEDELADWLRERVRPQQVSEPAGTYR